MTINLQDIHNLSRGWDYANPRTPADYMPVVYGDLTAGGNYGVWKCPCIDTVSYYYLIADHTVLSVANGNTFTVYDKDDTVISTGFTIVDDHTDENGRHVAIINFTADQKTSEPISVRCKGKNDGVSLIENPIEIAEDFITDVASGAAADFGTFALEAAKLVCTSYKAAGLVCRDKSAGFTLSELLYCFRADWWKNHLNEIIIMANKVNQSYDHKGSFAEKSISNLSAVRDEKNICNQAEVQYCYNYRLKEFEDGEDGDSTKDQLSQNIHGQKLKVFDYKWCRDATTIGLVQAVIIDFLKDPVWMISFNDTTLDNLHFERGDFALLTHSGLYDSQQNPFEDRICQIMSKRTDFNKKTIAFELVDKGVGTYTGNLVTIEKASDADKSIDIIISLPAGKQLLFTHGDGSTTVVTGPQTVYTVTIAYADTSAYTIIISRDIESITRLDIINEPITTITGIEHLNNIEMLLIYNNSSLTDMGLITDLVNLTYLWVCYNNLTDIGVFTSLVNLTYLRTDANSLTDSGTVTGLTALSRLYLGSNSYSDIGSIANLTGLLELKLNSNSFSQSELSDYIDQAWINRVALGNNSCVIKIESNDSVPSCDADAVAKIEGTGAYAGDGLKDAGCTVTYDA